MVPPLTALLTIITLATELTTNKYTLKFDRMVSELTVSPSAIECIDSAKQRTLFRGVLAGTSDPQIRNAFAIVYRDLAPIRVAGDLIFGQLASVANTASERVGDGALVVSDEDVLVKSRLLFDYVDGNKSGWLDRDEILASNELMNLIRVDEDDTPEAAVDRFMELADENGDGEISFVEFANATASRSNFRSVDEALTTAMLSATAGEERNKRRGAFGLRRSPVERFDAMLLQCLEWEEVLGCSPNDNALQVGDKNEECAVDVQLLQKEQDGEAGEEEGRMLQVLKGSLVGARCEPVVEALKMCYLEYSPLRLGGDIIFKLLTQVVKTQIPKQN